MPKRETHYSVDLQGSLADASLEDILEALAIPGLGKVGARRLLEQFPP